MEKIRKFNAIELYFDEQGNLEPNRSVQSFFPQSNLQSVIYANFKAADPLNVMGITFELYTGATIPERPMFYVGKVTFEGEEYQRWEFLLPDVVATSYRRDRDVNLFVGFAEREIANFIGVFDLIADLPSGVESESYAYVVEDQNVYRFDGSQWNIESQFETYNQVFGYATTTINVKKGIRIERDLVDIDASDLALKALAVLQGTKLNISDFEDYQDFITSEFGDVQTFLNTLETVKLNKSGDNADTDITIRDVTFNFGVDTDAIQFTDFSEFEDYDSEQLNNLQNFLIWLQDRLDEKASFSDLDVTYLRRDGEDAMTGNLSMGGNQIVNVGNVDGVNVSGLKSTTDIHIGRVDNPHQVTKSQVGLANVDNIQQATKSEFNTHVGNFNNPHQVTKTQVGLGNVTNDPQVRRDEMGVADGVATLDSNAKVPLNQLPDITKQPTLVFATDQAFTEADTSELIEGTKSFVVETRNAYVWDGAQWQLTSDADWENINLDWVNITNPPKNAANETLKDNNVYDVAEADAKFETITNVSTIVGNREYSEENIVVNGESITESLNAVDVELGRLEDAKEDSANVGDRTYTEQNVVTNDETLTQSLDALDVEVGRLEADKEDSANIGNRTYTEGNVVTNDETVTASVDALDVEVGRLEADKEDSVNIGNRQYTEQNIVTNDETITQSLDALDVEVGRLESDKEDSDNIGDRQYTTEHVVVDGQTVTQSIEALDTEAKRLDDDKMELGGSNSNVLDLKFQNQDTEDALEVGEIRLNRNLPQWQVSANTLHLVGRQLIERAINRTGATLTVGKPLFISGVFTPGQGPGTDRIEVELATRSNANGVFAVASCPSGANIEGCIITRGTVQGWNTSAYQPGDRLFLTDQPGEYSVGPVGDGEAEFFVGKVIRAANEGIVLINPTRIADPLFVTKSQLGTDIPILDEEGLILPQFLGDRYSDVFKGYGVFDTTDPEFPILLDFYLVDQWDLVNNQPIDPAVKAPYRAGTIYVTLNVTVDTMYRYDETSLSFVGLAPSPVGLGTTPGTAYPGDSGQANRDDIDLILSDYATDTNLNAHVTDTNNPHAVTKTQVGLSNVDNTSDADKPISTATQTALNLKADELDLQTHIDDTSNPHQTTATQVGLGNVLNYGVASQAEAEAGTANDKYMTPLRTSQLINQATIDGGEF